MRYYFFLLLIQLPLVLGLNRLEVAALMSRTSANIAPLMTGVSSLSLCVFSLVRSVLQE